MAEDEESLREMIAEILTAQGYRVLLGRDGQEALEIIQREREPIHLLMTDVVMPRMSGPELAQRAAVLRPDLKVLYLSGYASDVILKHGALEPGIQFLEKPFTPEVLACKVRAVLENTS